MRWTLVTAFDGISFAPSPKGTRISMKLDVSGGGRVIWYEQQERTPGENYLVWRQIAEPTDGGDIVAEVLGYESSSRVTHMIESEFLNSSTFAETERRFGKLERVWVNEQESE